MEWDLLLLDLLSHVIHGPVNNWFLRSCDGTVALKTESSCHKGEPPPRGWRCRRSSNWAVGHWLRKFDRRYRAVNSSPRRLAVPWPWCVTTESSGILYCGSLRFKATVVTLFFSDLDMLYQINLWKTHKWVTMLLTEALMLHMSCLEILPIRSS